MSTDLLTQAEAAVETRALQSAQPMIDLATMLQGLVMNPDVPVDKLEKIIELHERIQREAAKAKFYEDFAKMQRKLPIVIARKKSNNGKYAPLEDILEVVRPIISEFGFSLSHRTEFPEGGGVRTTGILAHHAGHERTSEFVTPADKSGNKNDVQALGSAMQYGRRYTTLDLVNITTRNEDDDAKRAATAPEPSGYQDWLDTLATKADEGLPALQQMWKVANGDAQLKLYVAHLTKTDPNIWNELKTRAAKVPAVKR